MDVDYLPVGMSELLDPEFIFLLEEVRELVRVLVSVFWGLPSSGGSGGPLTPQAVTAVIKKKQITRRWLNIQKSYHGCDVPSKRPV